MQRSASFTVLSFLNTTKYPPSLLYLLMTIGPGLMALAWFERPGPGRRRGVAEVLITFGRVPMFFYFLQWMWAKGAGFLLAAAFGRDTAIFFQTAVRMGLERARWIQSRRHVHWSGLTGVLVLYFPCRWFAGVKARRNDWWLSYV